jgi:hypothetical protein
MLPVHELATAAASGAGGGALLELLYILSAIFGTSIIGGGLAAWKSARGKGARDAGIDQTVKAVFDPKDGLIATREEFRTDLAAHIADTKLQFETARAERERQAEALKRIEHKLSRNGLDSQNVGDIAARVEIAVKGIDAEVRSQGTLLTAHIAQHDERDSQLAKRVDKLEAAK